MSASTATFTAEGAGAPRDPLVVPFNPASLKIAISNTIQEPKTGSKALQSVSRSAIKLDVELVFDSTESGEDVRGDTGVLKAMASPSNARNPALPKVTLAWGSFSFVGVIESLQETIDFFSAEGVPLRSTVQLSMQSLALDGQSSANPAAGGPSPAYPLGDQPTVAPPPPNGQGATGTASQAGNPAAGRALAAANGLASMRFTAGAGLAVGAQVSLLGPVGFTAIAGAGLGISGGAGIGVSGGAGIGISGGAGLGISGGAGIGVSGGAGIGISGSAGIGVSGGAGIGVSGAAGIGAASSAGFSFGASASAGVSATSGAFAGLGVSKSTSATLSLDVERLRPAVATFQVSADPGANFDATGRVIGTASAGLRADTGGGVQAFAQAQLV